MDSEQLRETLCLDRARWAERYQNDADKKYHQHLEDVESYFVNLGRMIERARQGKMFIAPWMIDIYTTYQQLVGPL